MTDNYYDEDDNSETQFVLGDTVKWQSQAGGRTKTKHGIIVEVVPSNQTPKSSVRDVRGSRGFESYVIQVESEDAKKVFYWPWPKNLMHSSSLNKASQYGSDNELFWLTHRLAGSDYSSLSPQSTIEYWKHPLISSLTLSERAILELIKVTNLEYLNSDLIDKSDFAILSEIFSDEDGDIRERISFEFNRIMGRVKKRMPQE